MNYVNIKPSYELSYHCLSTLPLRIAFGWCCAEMANSRETAIFDLDGKKIKKF